MDRSNKHSPRLDEELESETKGLVQGAPVDPRVDGHRKKEDTDDINAAPEPPR